MWSGIKQLLNFFRKRPTASVLDLGGRRVLLIKRNAKFSLEPPKGFWSPCHPSTARVFKASMTCSSGHTLTLRNHSVAADGMVTPSVVCLVEDCDFHEWVKLDKWQADRSV